MLNDNLNDGRIEVNNLEYIRGKKSSLERLMKALSSDLWIADQISLIEHVNVKRIQTGVCGDGFSITAFPAIIAGSTELIVVR
jgi:hypothetical protein